MVNVVAIGCGGRDFKHLRDDIIGGIRWLETFGITHLIEGGQSGGDKFWKLCGERIGSCFVITTNVSRANWKYFGGRAGPMRNKLSLDIALSIPADKRYCLAVPGNTGTRDMTTRSGRAGLDVIRFDEHLQLQR